jgi:hypothetical protein
MLIGSQVGKSASRLHSDGASLFERESSGLIRLRWLVKGLPQMPDI